MLTNTTYYYDLYARKVCDDSQHDQHFRCTPGYFSIVATLRLTLIVFYKLRYFHFLLNIEYLTLDLEYIYYIQSLYDLVI